MHIMTGILVHVIESLVKFIHKDYIVMTFKLKAKI